MKTYPPIAENKEVERRLKAIVVSHYIVKIKNSSVDMADWCKLNCQKQWLHIAIKHEWRFESNSDATRFKLTWG